MCTGPRLPTSQNPSLLLEFSASNDVSSFKNLIELGNQDVNSTALWYCRRSIGSDPNMGFAARTPLMIAALFGNLEVLAFILSLESDVNRRSETDGVTALHLAAAGGAASSADAVRILLAAGADIDSVDARGRRPGDLITASKEEQHKKKEYPVDASLPDIKSGVYVSDEFRMYTFKVKPCSRAYSHDWTECPFAHPGENARRRDPTKYAYSCVPCPEFRKGSCRKDDGCEYAHGVFESWLHPALYRTRLCKDEVGCGRRVCFFAHKLDELRTVNPTAASVNGLIVSSPRSAALQLPISRLKPTRSARDLDVDYELLGIEGYRRKLLDQIQNSASPRSNYSNLHGSMPGLDVSMAKAILSSRAASLAQRSQSFIDRAAVHRSPVMGLSNWSSPDGKLDWGIQGEELNKFRKSASFAMRSNPREMVLEEPDLSWVQSLVRDSSVNEPVVGRSGFDRRRKQFQMAGGELLSPWGEEQMVN